MNTTKKPRLSRKDKTFTPAPIEVEDSSEADDSEDDDDIEEDFQDAQRLPDFSNPWLDDATEEERAAVEELEKMYEASLEGVHPKGVRALKQLADYNAHMAKEGPGPKEERSALKWLDIVRNSAKGKKKVKTPTTPTPSLASESSMDMSQSLLQGTSSSKKRSTSVENETKRPRFVVDNPSTEFLAGTKSMNGFTIIGNEKIQSPQKNLPTEKQISVGYAIGDETHIALFEKQWKSKTITTKYYINFERKYVNAKKQYAVFTFSIPVECVPLLSDALVKLVAEHKKLTK